MLGVLLINLAVNQVVAGTSLIFSRRELPGFLSQVFRYHRQGLHREPVACARTWAAGAAFRFSVRCCSIRAHWSTSPFSWRPFFAWLIRRTRYGLRVRAAGQRPEVADTLGLGVYALRSQALIVSGLSRGLRARGSPSPTPTGS